MILRVGSRHTRRQKAESRKRKAEGGGKRRVFVCLLPTAFCLLAWGPACWAEQTSDQPVSVRKTEDGLHFDVPPDWPIEKRNGVVGPIPMEEYMARKFQAVERRLQELEKQTTALDLRLRVMEEAMKGAQRRLQSGETP